jgi:hypothetical protein
MGLVSAAARQGRMDLSIIIPVYNEVEALDVGCGMGRNSSDVLVRYRHPSSRTLRSWAELIDACT